MARDDQSAASSNLYQTHDTVTPHWAHAEQIRWNLLYNFLMGATILSLAWATVFASNPRPQRTIVLVALCLAGVLLSLVWIGLGSRSSLFVKMYADLGRQQETTYQAAIPCPFTKAEQLRGELSGPTKWAQTRRVIMLVPGLFALLFIALGILSFTQ